MKISCAVLGCGNIAQGYDSSEDDKVRTHIKAYLDNENCQLVGIFDHDQDKLHTTQEKWKGIPIYNDLDTLLSENRIDLVSICTPTDIHLSNFIDIVNSGIKKIWLEKPSSYQTSSIKKMIELEKQNELEVFVNYFRRYDAGFIKLREQMNLVGKISHVTGFYTKGIQHNASHLIDIIIWLFGEAQNVELLSSLTDEEYPSASFKISYPEFACNIFSLDFKNFEIFELDIIGSKGRIRVEEGGKSIKFYSVEDSKNYVGYKNLALKDIHEGTMDHFMKTGLLNIINHKDMPSLEDDLYIQGLINKILSKAS